MKSKDQQLLEEAYQTVTEGIFASVGSAFKRLTTFGSATKQVVDKANKFRADLSAVMAKHGKGPSPEINHTVNSFLNEVIDILDNPEMDPEMSLRLEQTFFAEIYKVLRNATGGASGFDIRKQFEIPNEIFNRLLNAYSEVHSVGLDKELRDAGY